MLYRTLWKQNNNIMEFKGTKEPWFACCMENSPHYVFATGGNVTICKPYIDQDMCEDLSLEEYRANALLISKAPEMLEMLIRLVDRMEENDLGSQHSVKRAKQLIEEATTI